MMRTMPETRIIRLHFYHRHCGPSFSYSNVVGSEIYRLREMAENNDHYDVQDHSKSSLRYQSKTYLTCYLALFTRYHGLLVKFSLLCPQGGYSFVVKIRIAKSGLKKLEISFYGVLQSIFRYLGPFRRDSGVWLTDRHSRSKRRSQLRYAAKSSQIVTVFPTSRLAAQWQSTSLHEPPTRTAFQECRPSSPWNRIPGLYSAPFA